MAFPVAALQHYLSEWRSGGTYTLASAWPSFWEFVLHIAAILLVEEILFYYTHRLAHWGPLYKWVHKEHHRFTAPVAMSAIYCHPLEHLACNLLPVHAGPLLMGSHLSVCAAWYVFAVLNTVNVSRRIRFAGVRRASADDNVCSSCRRIRGTICHCCRRPNRTITTT